MESIILIFIIGLIVFFFTMIFASMHLGKEHKISVFFGSAFMFLFRTLFIILFPLVYLLVFDKPDNNCCGDTATFASDGKLSIYILVGISIASYFIAIYKYNIFPPIIEIALNTLLIIGFILSILIHIHIFKEWDFIASVFCIPISIFFVNALRKRHKLLIEYLEDNKIKPESKYDKQAWGILTSDNKFLYFILLCFPALFLIASAMLLFGQKPDAMIRAFTDTYKHSFSQLDYMCENVKCGEHYLCSVAANGHRDIVKPVRYGERLGKRIICNRQLLVSNAFEELIWQKVPRLHKLIRNNYDKIGDLIHKHYGIFNNKYISDIVYYLMKPLEWMFLSVLYCFDKNPENRIASQYLSKEDKNKMNHLSNSK